MNINKLKKNTVDFIKLNNFNKLTRIQDVALDMAFGNKDLVAISKTGTGKTHAFLIPIFEKVDSSLNQSQIIIALPTKELAFQIYEKAKLMMKIDKNLRIKVAVGGQDRNKNIDDLKNPPHIIIGTAGRIKDLFVNNNLKIDSIKMFILDEADMMLEYGFLVDIDSLLSKIKKPQILCFSATLPLDLENFINKYLNNPSIIKIEDNALMNPKIKHYAVNAKHKTYNEVLLDLLPSFNPYICLIFANSKKEASETTVFLRENGYKVLELHGGMESRERKQALRQLNNEEYSYVVCSDVMSRGIDIEGVSHVISLGLPSDLSFFTHRSGRTGRSGREGYCFTIYQEKDLSSLNTLSKEIDFEIRVYKKGNFKILKFFNYKRSIQDEKREKEILKTITRKNEKVKPNYKKKKNELIKKIKQKERQTYIRNKIKEEKKERYKANAKALYEKIKNK